MSRIIATLNDLAEVPAIGKAFVYVKQDKTLALKDSDGEEFILADTRSDMKAIARRLMTGRTRLTAAQAAGTYWFSEAATLVSTGLASPLAGVYIDATDFPDIAGVPTKLRLRVQAYTNDVAPGSTITLGLYPVSRPTVSGGAGVLIYTPGTVVPGSTVTLSGLTVDGMFAQSSAEFAVPATGHYAIGFTSSAAIPTNSHVHMQFQLQAHNA